MQGYGESQLQAGSELLLQPDLQNVQIEENLSGYFWLLPKQDDSLIYAQLAFN